MMMQGWQCPKCGRVNAPWASTCPCYYENQKVTCKDTTRPVGDYKTIYTYGPTGSYSVLKKDEEE